MKRSYQLLGLMGLISPFYSSTTIASPLRWDWKKIDHSWQDLSTKIKTLQHENKLPNNFQWGVADSAYQTEGPGMGDGLLAESNWTAWGTKLDSKGNLRTKDPIENAINRWELWQEDIDRLAACGFDTYRMSVDWSKIEPKNGTFNQDVMNHYKDVCAYAHKKGIRVMVCLWHFIHPLWFDQLGAFEKRENNKHFVNFSQYVCNQLKDSVSHWAPFNEPEAYAMTAYFVGKLPPGKKGELTLTGKVIANMLDAHVKTAEALKAIQPEAKICFIKVVQNTDPFHWWNPLEVAGSKFFDGLINDSIIDFFATGKFRWTPWVSYDNKNAKKSIDYFGVNYYCAQQIAINFPFTPFVDHDACHEWQSRTSKGSVIYPENMYRSLKRCAKVGKPMIVTENGVPDTNDNLKDEFIRRHLYAVFQAANDGCDIRGYHYWTLMDTWGWTSGFQSKYGLYKVEDDKKTRTLRENAKPFLTFVREQQSTKYKLLGKEFTFLNLNAQR